MEVVPPVLVVCHNPAVGRGMPRKALEEEHRSHSLAVDKGMPHKALEEEHIHNKPAVGNMVVEEELGRASELDVAHS